MDFDTDDDETELLDLTAEEYEADLRTAFRKGVDAGREQTVHSLKALTGLNGHTPHVVSWLKGWDESAHPRDHGKFAKKPGSHTLTSEQRDALRELHRHFPQGIAHLLNEQGAVHPEHLESDEDRGHRAAIEAHKVGYHTAAAKVQTDHTRNGFAQREIEWDEAFNGKLNALPKAAEFDALAEGTEHEDAADALWHVYDCLDTLEESTFPDYPDQPDHEGGGELPDEPQGWDELEDAAVDFESARDEHTQHAESFADDSATFRAEAADTCNGFRTEQAEHLHTLKAACHEALALPPEAWEGSTDAKAKVESLSRTVDGLLAELTARAKVGKGFDPNEKRDESGKWTSGGGDSPTAETTVQPAPESPSSAPELKLSAAEAWKHLVARKSGVWGQVDHANYTGTTAPVLLMSRDAGERFPFGGVQMAKGQDGTYSGRAILFVHDGFKHRVVKNPKDKSGEFPSVEDAQKQLEILYSVAVDSGKAKPPAPDSPQAKFIEQHRGKIAEVQAQNPEQDVLPTGAVVPKGHKKCSRCGGAGLLPQFKHVENGVCFTCEGDGVVKGKTTKKAFSEDKVKRDGGKFAKQEGSNGVQTDTAGGSAGAHQAPSGMGSPEHAAKVQALLARTHEVPRALRERVVDWVHEKYKKLAARYGDAGAKAVLAAMVVLAPVPLPGSSLIPVALAEAVLRIRRAARVQKGMPLCAADEVRELVADALRVLKKGFDPNEKRDESGKWTAGGGAGAKPEAPEWDGTLDEDYVEEDRRSLKDLFAEGDHADVYLATATYYPDSDSPGYHPASDGAALYRWETRHMGDTPEYGEWTTDEDKARADGERFAESGESGDDAADDSEDDAKGTNGVPPAWEALEFAAVPRAAVVTGATHDGDTIDAIADYCGGEFGAFNRYLRGESRHIDPRLENSLELIREALADAPEFPNPVLVHRGINLPPDKAKALFDRFARAADDEETVSMQGLVSTSQSAKVAGGFGGLRFEIAARKGLSVAKIAGAPEEEEILLDHGSEFVVHEVDRKRGVIRLEQVV